MSLDDFCLAEASRWRAACCRDKTAGSTILETTMPKSLAALLLAAFVSASALSSDADTVLAQGVTPSLPGAQPTTSLPGAPRLPPGPLGGSGNYVATAAANEHASFLWVVDNVQHAVVLCEKADTRDFSCTKKPLP